MNKILYASDKNDKSYPIKAVFKEYLFEDFKIQFPKAVELILSGEEINTLTSCKYEDFCEFINTKGKNNYQKILKNFYNLIKDKINKLIDSENLVNKEV